MTRMRSIASSCIVTVALFLASSTARGEYYAGPDHVWVIGVDTTHPVGIAWDWPTGDGMHKSVHTWLCFGMLPVLELTMPLAAAGLLMLCVCVALLFVVTRRCSLQDSVVQSEAVG